MLDTEGIQHLKTDHQSVEASQLLKKHKQGRGMRLGDVYEIKRCVQKQRVLGYRHRVGGREGESNLQFTLKKFKKLR